MFLEHRQNETNSVVEYLLALALAVHQRVFWIEPIEKSYWRPLVNKLGLAVPFTLGCVLAEA